MSARLELVQDPTFYRALLREKSKRAAEVSLHEFTKQAWHVIEPGTPFMDNWHLQAITEHLEAVTAGEIRKLLINMPPRHCKSIQVAVMWPVWVWIERPEYRWLFASYAGTLSTRDSLKCRRLIESPWFQERWGHRFTLTGDQNAKTFFENDRFGYRMATSVGAGTTGHGGDTLCVDDPHNSVDAQSDALRESTLEWWDQAMSTRHNDPRTGSTVIVMQRLHERDLSGHELVRGGWEHLCLPAEYESGRRISTSLGYYDPRTKDGELLWPDRFGEKELDKLKSALGEYGSAGQLQQRPSPAGGGIIKVDHFQKWPADKPIPALDYVLQSYDTAFSEKTSGDPSACTTWGLFTLDQQRCAILLDCWAEQVGYPTLRKRVMTDWKALYNEDTDNMLKGRRADQILVEEKGSGISLLQDLRLANIPAVAYNPGRADKIARAHQATPVLELGMLFIPESKKSKGLFVSWARSFVQQCESFPGVEHDDLVDTWSQAMIFLKNSGLLELPVYEEPEQEDRDYYQERQKGNPYAV